VAQARGNSLVQDARLFALINIAQADATFAIWDTKYTYNLWRPVTAIRAADTDGNPDTVADPAWTPYLVTPAIPAYNSGHSGYSAAAVTALAAFFGSDHVSFSLSSDSLPGATRSYASFSAAAQECADSRVYAGIHWRFDCTVGLTMGNEVGDYVATHCLLPAWPSDDEDGAAATSGPASLAAGAVTTPARVAPETRLGLIWVFGPPGAPAGPVSPATSMSRLAPPATANETASPPAVPSSVISSNAAAGPAVRRALKPAATGVLTDGLAGDSLEPVSWRGDS